MLSPLTILSVFFHTLHLYCRATANTSENSFDSEAVSATTTTAPTLECNYHDCPTHS